MYNNDYQYDDDNYYEQYHYDEEDLDNYGYDYSDYGKATGNKFQIIPQSQLFNQLIGIIGQCETYTALPFGWSLLLMKEFKWQVDNLPQYFQNMATYKNKIKYNQNLRNPNDQELKKPMYGQCIVCCEKGKMRMNICGHIFCQDCWLGQIKADIDSMKPFSHCLNCTTPILYQFIIEILSNPAHQKHLIRYKKLLCQDFTTSHRSYQVCLGTDCVYCIKCEDYMTTTVKCHCGKSFCFKCKNDDHSPCTCDERSKWVDLVLKEQADAKWMSQNAKLCPWCNKAVERSAGCNYMACICGKSFCYMCSKPWQPDHKDHFKCHIYKKKNDSEINREKAILEKMNFYADQYLNANKNAIQLKKVDAFSKRKILFQILKIDLTDSDFIQQAYRFAIECCEGLKWIYVYSYFVKFKNDQIKQGQYQKYQQNLLVKLSVQLKNLLSQLETKRQQHQFIDQQYYTNKFMQLKKNITNYYTCTKQFKQKFIEQLQRNDSIIKRYSQDKQEVQGNKNAKNQYTVDKKGKKK